MNGTAASKSAAVTAAARVISKRLGMETADRPTVGVILGSGLGRIAEQLIERGGRAIGYGEIPGMPATHVVGHQGRFVAGLAGDCPVIMMQGRIHHYEGHAFDRVTLGVRALEVLGIRRLIVTNAAGGIRNGMVPGDLMLISGHLVFPACGVMQQDGLSRAGARPGRLWNPGMREQGRNTFSELRVHEGVYAMMSGPCYETPAEIRMLRTLGADAVGMSTVPESLVAAAAGIDVLGVSCITNIAAGLSAATLSHTDVTETAAAVQDRFADWLWRLIPAVAGPDPQAA